LRPAPSATPATQRDKSLPERLIRLRGFFSKVLCSGGGGWDDVTEENAEDFVALLCDHVAAALVPA
jgi:hypothetical protein